MICLKISLVFISLSVLILFFMFYLRSNSWNIDSGYILKKIHNEFEHYVDNNFERSSECYDVQKVNKAVDGKDLENYIDVCGSLSTIYRTKISSQLCPSCRFKSPVFMKKHKPFIALASFPGSGNSWTRELLESMTGIYTGSVYEDPYGQFEGSKLCALHGGVYIVKTHRSDNEIRHEICNETIIDFRKAMLILRNPYDAMESFYNLQIKQDKIGFARRDQFKGRRWRTFVRASAQKWRAMNLYWLTNFKKPLHVIIYEELTTRTYTELFNVGKFLNLNSTYLDLYCARHCLKPKYHRVGKPEWMTKSVLFDDELREVVNSAINQVLIEIQDRENIEKALKSYILKTNGTKMIRPENVLH